MVRITTDAVDMRSERKLLVLLGPRSWITEENRKWGNQPAAVEWVFNGLSFRRFIDIQTFRASKVWLVSQMAAVALVARQRRSAWTTSAHR